MGVNCKTNPQQLRKRNEQKYKAIKNLFKKQKEGEQIFVIEIAVSQSKLCKAVNRKKKRYNELASQLVKKRAKISLTVVVIGPWKQ